MADDAVSRLAASITQLTLCQVSTDEIDAAIKLLDKACQKLRGILDVPPQRLTDLEAAIRQLRQLSCVLDSCTIFLPVTKSARHRKHCYLCHARLKAQAHHPQNWTHRFLRELMMSTTLSKTVIDFYD